MTFLAGLSYSLLLKSSEFPTNAFETAFKEG